MKAASVDLRTAIDAEFRRMRQRRRRQQRGNKQKRESSWFAT